MKKSDNYFNNDPHWIWGIFYYNKDDKRIFPPKRNKYFGWTVNFANYRSVVAFLAMILFFGAIVFLIENNRK